MKWLNILEKREHVFIFQDKKPDILLINNIISEMHTYMPVKQNKLLFNISIVDNTIDNTRKIKFYESTRTNYEPNTKYRYNPQVLAPYLFLFFVKPELTDNEALLQIGMASMFINFSAINQGIDIGFCKCINQTEFVQNNYRGIELAIGLGYKNNVEEYFCPVDKITKTIPPKYEKKCLMEEYIFVENA